MPPRLHKALPAHPDCAVCAEGFAPGVAYSCRKCSGSAKKFALALASVVGLAMFLLAGLLLWYMGRVAIENSGGSMEIARGGWGQNGRSCRSFPLKLLPVTAMKIVVTVWQIIYQVCGGSPSHEDLSYVRKLKYTSFIVLYRIPVHTLVIAVRTIPRVGLAVVSTNSVCLDN